MPRDDQFALIIKQGSAVDRKYPTDTIDSTVDSINRFFQDSVGMSKDEIGTAGYFLKQACILYGINTVEALQPFQKQASNVVKKIEKAASQGRQEYRSYALGGRYPLDTPDLVKQASQFFDENWRKLAQPSRREYATNVQKQANKLNVQVGGNIQKFASNSFSYRVPFELQKRARLAGEVGAPAFEKLAKFVGQCDVDEFIVVLDKLDKKYGIDKYYPAIDDPMTTVLDKEAAGPSGAMWDIDGVTYTEDDMHKALAHPDIIMMYGANLVSQLREPAAFDELPINDKKVILQYAKS